MVDHLDGDAAGFWFVEGTGGVAVEGGPGLLVDLGLEGRLERLVGIVRPQEIGVADEEALLVVVRVDEPAGDPLRTVAAHLAGVGVEDVHAIDLHPDLSSFGGKDVDVRLAEDDEQVPLAGILQVVGHVQVCVHPGLEDGNSAKLVEFRGVGVVIEGAGDQDIEVGVARLPGGSHQVGAGDGAEFRTDEDGRPLLRAGLRIAFDVAPFGADQLARPGGERREDDPILLVGLLDTGDLEVLQDSSG
jgi:hypothetical protein